VTVQLVSLFVNDLEYTVSNFTASTSLFSGEISFTVNGKPFSGVVSADYLVIRPNSYYTEVSFTEPFDEIEEFLLNRLIVPRYTANFQVPKQNDNGEFYTDFVTVTWPLDGTWNLDIRTFAFQDYVEKLGEIAESFDRFRTNTVARFLITDAFKEFDTQDQHVAKILQIWGREFDEIKKFIDGLSFMNSVNYNIGNDIPSALLKNLSQTLGWNINISPISEEDFLESVFGNGNPRQFSGYARSQTPNELNFQYYRNLILNSAYLFKSKGTRKSIECLLRMIGAPEALIEFNEYIYVADRRINMSEFNQQYAQISLGSFTQEFPILDTTDVFSIQGIQYTGFTTTLTNANVLTTRTDYPVDNVGCPKMPTPTEDYFFQVGGGWYQSTPDHRMPEFVIPTNAVFTGNNPDYQTQLLPFNYGQEYLQRYREFPYMDLGYKLRNVQDNKKSWVDTEPFLRVSSDGGFTAYYSVGEECLTLNVKNVDIMMNPAQGLVYDVWTMSRQTNFPIPEQGLFYTPPSPCQVYNPYPKLGGVDWTTIVPKPKQKTFFEFAQTFWRNMINTRNRQFITDGKTGGYPTLQSIYWKYLESLTQAGIPNDNFTYRTMIDFVNGMGTYWIKLIEQMVPATTIWNTGVRLENSIFHRQKFVWRRQEGCRFLPIPCDPCNLVSNFYVVDCPIQKVTCGLYPWNSDPNITSFGVALYQTLMQFFTTQGINPNTCQLNTTIGNWYIDIRINGVQIAQEQFYKSIGTVDSPTTQD